MREANFDGVRAAVEAVRAENRRLYQENEQLRGQLREARREARRLGRRLEGHAGAAANCRRLAAAAAGAGIALACLAHSMVLAGVTWH